MKLYVVTLDAPDYCGGSDKSVVGIYSTMELASDRMGKDEDGYSWEIEELFLDDKEEK